MQRQGQARPRSKVTRPFPAMIERRLYHDAWAVDIAIIVTSVIYTGRFAEPVRQWQPIAKYVPALCIKVRDYYLVWLLHMFMDVRVPRFAAWLLEIKDLDLRCSVAV